MLLDDLVFRPAVVLSVLDVVLPFCIASICVCIPVYGLASGSFGNPPSNTRPSHTFHIGPPSWNTSWNTQHIPVAVVVMPLLSSGLSLSSYKRSFLHGSSVYIVPLLFRLAFDCARGQSGTSWSKPHFESKLFDLFIHLIDFTVNSTCRSKTPSNQWKRSWQATMATNNNTPAQQQIHNRHYPLQPTTSHPRQRRMLIQKPTLHLSTVLRKSPSVLVCGSDL